MFLYIMTQEFLKKTFNSQAGGTFGIAYSDGWYLWRSFCPNSPLYDLFLNSETHFLFAVPNFRNFLDTRYPAVPTFWNFLGTRYQAVLKILKFWRVPKFWCRPLVIPKSSLWLFWILLRSLELIFPW